MLANYTRIIDLLRKCNTNDVAQAEIQLQQLQISQIQLLNFLQQSLKDFTLQQYVHTMAAAKINEIFTSNRMNQTQEFCYKYFTGLLTDGNISIVNKKQLRRSLMYCIERCNKQYLSMWKQLTQKALINEELFEIGLLLLTAFSCAQIKNNMILELDEKPFEFTISLLCNKSLNIQIVRQISFIKLINSIFQSWKIIVQYLIHYSNNYTKQLLIKFGSSDNLCNCLRFIYTHYSNGQNRHYLYLNDLDQECTIQINDMKKSALQLHHLILKSNLKFQCNTAIYAFTGTQIQIYINTLCYISLQKNLIQQYDLEQITVIMIKILKCMSQDSPKILSKSWKQMIHFIIFPFILASDEEVDDFQNNANSFIEVSQDCCDNQKMGILKTQSVSFLLLILQLSNEIQQNSEQMMSNNSIKQRRYQNQTLIGKYVINFVIASIKHHLNMQYISSNDFLSEQGLPQSISLLPIQTAFLVLSAFSYLLLNYSKQIQDIKVILCNDHIWKLPPLQRARIYVFLAYNSKEILGTEQNQTMKYLIDMAFNEQNHATATYCALDFIFNRIDFLYSQKNIERIINRIIKNRCNNFWKLLRQVVHLYWQRFSQKIFILLVESIYKRIKLQLQSIYGQEVKVIHVITNLLTLLRIISEKEQILQNKIQLKSLLWEINKLYPVALKNYFQEEVVKIINCFLFYANKSQIQNPQMHKFVPLFIGEFQKCCFQSTYFFVAFNHFVSVGEFQNTVKPIYQVIKKGLIQLLNEKRNEHEYIHKKLPVAHSLLVLQNIIALHGGQFIQDQLESLSKFVQCLYPKPIPIDSNNNSKYKLVIQDRTLLARALNLQFLCYMYYQNQNTLISIKQYSDLNVFYGYDVSVLVNCIKIQMSKTKQLNNFIQLLIISIKVIYYYILMDNQYKGYLQKQLQKKKKRNYEDDNEQIQQQQSQNNEIKKKKQDLIVRIKKSIDYQIILTLINTPFLKNQKKILGRNKCIKQVKQIKQEFITQLNSIRSKDSVLYQSILCGFDQNIKEKLKVITECQYDDIIQGNMLNLIGRKKFKILRIRQSNINKNNDNQPQYEDDIKERRYQMRFNQDQSQSDQDLKILKYQKAEKKSKLKNLTGKNYDYH